MVRAVVQQVSPDRAALRIGGRGDVELEYGFERLLVRLGPALQGNRVPVDDRGEGRGDVPVDGVLQVRDERDGDLDPLHLVPRPFRPVEEIDAPVDQLDIIK